MNALTIVSQPQTYAETTINDIPYGSLFFGTIVHPRSSATYTGFWLRGNGDGSWESNEMAISLDHMCASPGYESRPVIVRKCVPVKGYRLVKRATLTIQEFA